MKIQTENIRLDEGEDYEIWRIQVEKPMRMSYREAVAFQKGWEKGFKAGLKENSKQ